ncbi:MAG: hypothetical protein PHW29_04475 [Flavobacterium sp.]|nr:hypothetical protein [Flavobacterium sp.]
MFIAPIAKVKITRTIDDDFMKPAEVIFYPEQTKIVSKLIEEFLKIKNTSLEHIEQVSSLSYLMLEAKELGKFETHRVEFLKIISIYK